jgi:hypothetical protein
LALLPIERPGREWFRIRRDLLNGSVPPIERPLSRWSRL